MRGHIRVREGPRGTTYQLVVFVGMGTGAKRKYVYETVEGSRRDAENRLAQLVTDVNAGRLGPSRSITVNGLVDAWWDASTGHLSPNTRIGYRGVLDRHIFRRSASAGSTRSSPPTSTAGTRCSRRALRRPRVGR